MNRHLALTSAIISASLVLAPAIPANSADTLEQVKRSGVLVMGVADDLPPFAFRDAMLGRDIVGYDADYAEALARILGVRLRLEPVTAADMFSKLLDGNINIIASLTRSYPRSAVVSFTDNYLVSGQKVLAPVGTIRSHEDLEKKKIGAVVGTFSESCARDRCKVSTIIPFNSYLEGLEALKRGRIDVFTSDESVLVDLLAGLPGGKFEIPDVLILREEYHLAVLKEDETFLASVNAAIEKLKSSGEADRIRNKWFAPRKGPPPPAYGAVVRKASTRPRFLGIMLNGVMYPGTKVEIFGLGGKRLGNGVIASAINDEFYLDVEESVYDSISAGALVAMNMTTAMAMDVLLLRQHMLEKVRDSSEEDAARVKAEIDSEALRKQQRAIEMDMLRERYKAEAQRDRALYYRYYDGRQYYP